MKFTLTLLALLFASPVWAQPAPTPPPQNAAGLSPEQVKLIKDNLRGISDVMGVPKPEATPKSEPETPKKSMADVADHALEMMSGLVVKVAGTLEKVAPKFWAIMVKQQYAKAVADTIVPISLTLFSLGWGLYFKRKVGYPPLGHGGRCPGRVGAHGRLPCHGLDCGRDHEACGAR